MLVFFLCWYCRTSGIVDHLFRLIFVFLLFLLFFSQTIESSEIESVGAAYRVDSASEMSAAPSRATPIAVLCDPTSEPDARNAAIAACLGRGVECVVLWLAEGHDKPPPCIGTVAEQHVPVVHVACPSAGCVGDGRSDRPADDAVERDTDGAYDWLAGVLQDGQSTVQVAIDATNHSGCRGFVPWRVWLTVIACGVHIIDIHTRRAGRRRAPVSTTTVHEHIDLLDARATAARVCCLPGGALCALRSCLADSPLLPAGAPASTTTTTTTTTTTSRRRRSSSRRGGGGGGGGGVHQPCCCRYFGVHVHDWRVLSQWGHDEGGGGGGRNRNRNPGGVQAAVVDKLRDVGQAVKRILLCGRCASAPAAIPATTTTTTTAAAATTTMPHLLQVCIRDAHDSSALPPATTPPPTRAGRSASPLRVFTARRRYCPAVATATLTAAARRQRRLRQRHRRRAHNQTSATAGGRSSRENADVVGVAADEAAYVYLSFANPWMELLVAIVGVVCAVTLLSSSGCGWRLLRRCFCCCCKNRHRPQDAVAVSYTHLTLPTIYSV